MRWEKDDYVNLNTTYLEHKGKMQLQVVVNLKKNPYNQEHYSNKLIYCVLGAISLCEFNAYEKDLLTNFKKMRLKKIIDYEFINEEQMLIAEINEITLACTKTMTALAQIQCVNTNSMVIHPRFENHNFPVILL